MVGIDLVQTGSPNNLLVMISWIPHGAVWLAVPMMPATQCLFGNSEGELLVLFVCCAY